MTSIVTTGAAFVAAQKDREQVWLNFLDWYRDKFGGVPNIITNDDDRLDWELFQAIAARVAEKQPEGKQKGETYADQGNQIMTTEQQPSDTPISDLISETLRLAFENQELIHKDSVKTREINTLTVENRKLLDALRKANAELEAYMPDYDPGCECSQCSSHAGLALATITEALK